MQTLIPGRPPRQVLCLARSLYLAEFDVILRADWTGGLQSVQRMHRIVCAETGNYVATRFSEHRSG
jgi:hypothetical protein